MPELEASLLLDLGYFAAGMVAKFLVLFLLMFLLARKSADVGAGKVFVTALLVSLLDGFAHTTYGAFLGPFVPAFIFFVTGIVLLAACDASFGAAMRVAVPFVGACFGINLGIQALATERSPERKTIASAHADMMTGLSPTNSPEEIAARVDFALTELQVMASTNEAAAPPPEMAVSLEQIAANLPDTNAPVSFTDFPASAVSAGGELAADGGGTSGGAATSPGVDPVELARATLDAGVTASDAGTATDAGGDSAPAPVDLVDRAEEAYVTLASVDKNAPVKRADPNDAVFVRFNVHGMDEEEGLEGKPVTGAIPNAVWIEAQSQLKIAGLMSIRGKDLMVYVDGELRYLGDKVSTQMGGTNYWWRIAGERYKTLQLERLGATTD